MTAAAPSQSDTPGLADIRETARSLEGRINRTPTIALNHDLLARVLPEGAVCTLKLEHLQKAGSFKSRGVLVNLDRLTLEERARGVAGVSAGNHAIALAWGARAEGIHATVMLPQTADPARVAMVRDLGAEVVLCETIAHAFTELDRAVAEQGRVMIHPFDGPGVALATGTLGLEMAGEHQGLEAVVIPVGGGGLIGGIAAALKQLDPAISVYGVEPEGAAAMSRSLAAGRPTSLDAVRTIADSLGAPMTLPDTFNRVRRFVDDIAIVSDEDLTRAMGHLFSTLKLAAEPACAASLAAACGPLRDTLAGKRVGLIACGSNIGLPRYVSLMDRFLTAGAAEQ